jgi:hypothetical protein
MDGVISFNPEVVRSKLQHLLRGLPVEDEFALLCLWSGRCKLIHKLDPAGLLNVQLTLNSLANCALVSVYVLIDCQLYVNYYYSF